MSTTNYQITRLKHSDLRPAPFNRETIDGQSRSGFDSKSLKELADSIREQGIVQPLIVRKISGKPGYELVAGERRWTAAGIVNKKMELPCIIRQLTEGEAREINAIENLQRVGLHPIEEARGYQALLDITIEPRYTIERIADKVSKSAAFVYARLKLLRAPELAQRASYKGKLTHSNLLLIARIPDPKLALQATLEILAPFTKDEKEALDPNVEPLSYRAAKKHIQDKYMIRLKDAPFDTGDPELVPVTWEITKADLSRETTTSVPQPELGTSFVQLFGGTCTNCPCLTGNMKALFPDVESSDVCTNTTCYKRKVAADFKQREAKAKANGDVLLKDKKAEAMFYNGELLSSQTEFVDLDAPCPADKKKRDWNTVLGEHVPDQLVQARDDKGKVHFLLPMKDVIEAAEKAKVKLPEPTHTNTALSEEDRKKQTDDREAAVAIAKIAEAEALSDMRAKVAKMKPDTDFWRGILFQMLGRSEILDRHGIQNDKQLTVFLKKRNDGELRALMVESLFFYDNVSWQGDFSEQFVAGCKEFGVDYKALHKKAGKLATAKPEEFQKTLEAISPEAK